jgi:hypothetical protein
MLRALLTARRNASWFSKSTTPDRTRGLSMTMSRRRIRTRSRDKRSQRCEGSGQVGADRPRLVRRIYRLLSGAYTDLNLTGWERLCISMPNVENVGILPRLLVGRSNLPTEVRGGMPWQRGL